MPPCFYWLDNGRRSHETPLRKNYGSVIALYKKSRESKPTSRHQRCRIAAPHHNVLSGNGTACGRFGFPVRLIGLMAVVQNGTEIYDTG